MTEPRLIFLSGKGGVGKTTCALALGHALAERGPVTVVSLDPAHNLGDLARRPLSREPVVLAEGLTACEPDLEALARERTERIVDLLHREYGHLDALSLGGLPELLRSSPSGTEQAVVDALAKQEDAPPRRQGMSPGAGAAARWSTRSFSA